jgi:CBS domain-containing protein
MNAGEVMNTPIVAASLKASCREVALYMLLGGFSGVPIADGEGALVGIVTEIDLLRAVRSGKALDGTPVADIMTRNVITVDVATPIQQIMDILDSAHILRVPVTRNGALVGIVSRPDLLRAAVEPQFIRIG